LANQKQELNFNELEFHRCTWRFRLP